MKLVHVNVFKILCLVTAVIGEVVDVLSSSGEDNSSTRMLASKTPGEVVANQRQASVKDKEHNNRQLQSALLSIITTVAGGGNGGDGEAATSAALNSPYGMALDSSGDLFITEYANDRVRKVQMATGIITLFAGTGVTGSGGDGGPATSASLHWPFAAAVDKSDNLYIADTYNDRVRMVSRVTGIITTFAGTGTGGDSGDGGAATSTALLQPIGLAVDSSDNVYIVDKQNYRIRMVNRATGIITTFAGGGQWTNGAAIVDGRPATDADLSEPEAIAFDSSDNLFIAQPYSNRILMVSRATGILTTFAVNGTAIHGGDGGPATSAALALPCGVAVDSSGNLYIADTRNDRIRMVDKTTGIISTYAGTGAQGYGNDGDPATSSAVTFPYGVAVDSSNNLFIVDLSYRRIRRVARTCAAGMVVSGSVCVPVPAATHTPTSAPSPAPTPAPTLARTATKPPTKTRQPGTGTGTGTGTGIKTVLRKRAYKHGTGSIDVDVDVDVAVRSLPAK